jgi:hypothetical protein
MRKLTVTLVGLVLVASFSFGLLAQGLTADEILAKVEEKSFMGGGVGSMVTTVKFDVTTSDGETTSYTFKVFSVRGVEGEPDKALIVYLAPDLVAGTMFLTWTPEEGDARMWLYLPALGLVKELITPESRGQEFVSGSGISREEIAEGFKYKEDYTPELLGEEEAKGMSAYVLLLIPKEGHETDWKSIKLWVEKDEFAVIRAEFYDENGEVAKTMDGDDFYTDSVGYIAHKIVLKDLVEGSTSTITVLDRQTGEIPADYFDPEKLPTLKIEGL